MPCCAGAQQLKRMDPSEQQCKNKQHTTVLQAQCKHMPATNQDPFILKGPTNANVQHTSTTMQAKPRRCQHSNTRPRQSVTTQTNLAFSSRAHIQYTPVFVHRPVPSHCHQRPCCPQWRWPLLEVCRSSTASAWATCTPLKEPQQEAAVSAPTTFCHPNILVDGCCQHSNTHTDTCAHA